MKRFLLPLAALALVITSCDTETKDSYTTFNFSEYNLISDLQDEGQPAQISSSIYTVMVNLSQGCVDVRTSDLVINNQKVAFETDTMAYSRYWLISQDATVQIDNVTFSSKANVGIGAEVTDMNGWYTGGNYNVSSLYVPEVQSTSSSMGYRLIMGYDLNERYHVQTFWPLCYYVGNSYVSGQESYNTNNTVYRVELNAEKNTARVVIYYPEFTAENVDVPQAIVVEDIPVKFTNKLYYLESESPKTRVLGAKDDVTALVDTDKFNVTDFSFVLTSSDLTEATITYRIDGNRVTFNGTSVVRQSN